MNTTITLLLSLMQTFFAKNQLIEEVIPIIEQAAQALASAKAGQSFSISFPESIGRPGVTTLSWSPNPVVTASTTVTTSPAN
jgi:hypothetical protein